MKIASQLSGNKPAIKSVFVVSLTYVKGKIKYPARLNNEVIGYYSDLKSAVRCIKSKGPQWHRQNDFAFKIYEIKAFVLNREFDEEWQRRIYDVSGKLHGTYQFTIFRGRDKKDCKFRLGELVEFIDFDNAGTRLNVGIITELPPDKKRVKEITRGHGVRLDSGEDSYRLLSGYGKREHTGSQACYLFPLSGKVDEKVEKYLRMRIKKRLRK